MKADQVDQALRQKFLADNERIVFWDDSKGEFSEYISRGLPSELEGVTVLEPTKLGGLPTKLLLEREDPSGKYLLYSTGKQPSADEDWLLDVRLYSAEFHADVASIWLQELGLNGLFLRDHLEERSEFLRSKERRKRLGQLIGTEEDEVSLDLKMMAVLTGSEVADFFSVLQALFHGQLIEGQVDLFEPPKILETFEKMGLSERFWQFVKRDFAYDQETPGVAPLLRHLFASELLHQLRGEKIDSLAHFELPNAGRQNAVVFLTQWRDSSVRGASYDAAATAVANDLNLGTQLGGLSLEALSDIFTFWDVEKVVLSRLKMKVLEEEHTADVEGVSAVASARKAGHWLAGSERDLPERKAAGDSYDAIVAAAELFALRAKHQHHLAFDSPQGLLQVYRDELYRFDKLYRRFCTKARSAQGEGWDLLKDLAEKIEGLYDQSFLQPLGMEWSRLLDAGFLETWELPEMPSQQGFFADNIRPHLDQSERKRAYVIISDALRYEAAQGLTEVLKGRYRMDARLDAMLGVLPSYTGLGMASLLPHDDLGYSEKGEVLVDGKPAAGTQGRNKQLATVEGMACQANELQGMKLEDAREFTQGKRVVYIYHNVIDARGDSGSTEGETFSAVEDCIQELADLAKFCINKLNAAKVWVTADHGFLFQEAAPGLTDKSELAQKPENAVKVKKRYVIGRSLGAAPEAHHGATKNTAGASGDMEFWIPRGANRFHFTGGARFVHGGAMPQEVVVPLVTVTQLRGTKKDVSRSKKVSVQVLGANHKITTPKYRFELIQTEAVSERRMAITLRGAVYDGALAVTSVATVVFDSTSSNIEERKKAIRLELSTKDFDKSKPYRLVLRDAETDAEVESVPVVIDRSFDDDF